MNSLVWILSITLFDHHNQFQFSESIWSCSQNWCTVALACISTACGNNILSHAANLDETEVILLIVALK